MSETNPQETKRSVKITYIISAIAISCLMIGASLGIIISGTTPSVPSVIEPGSMASTATYVIFKDGSTTYLKDGSSGAVSYSSASSSAAIQAAINAVGNSTGGSIYLKFGTYTLTTMLNVTKANITISADSGTRFQGTIMPMLTVWGSTDWYTMADIHLSNIAFIYYGSYAAGCIVKFHYVVGGIYGGGASITNVKIWNMNGGAFPTNREFVGLLLEDCIGVRISQLSLYYLGTGLVYQTTYHDPPGAWYDGSHNYYDYVTAGYCYQAAWYRATGGTVTNEVWNQLKVQVCARYGILSTVNGAPTDLILESPQIEQMYGTYAGTGNYMAAVELNGTRFICNNGLINMGINTSAYGFRLNYSFATITNTVFNSPGHPIDINSEYITLIQNEYDGVNTKLTFTGGSSVRSYNDPYVVEAWGYETITGAVNSFSFLHHCAVTPDSVTISTLSSTCGDYAVATVNTTDIQIWFTNQPGGGSYGFYWHAHCF